MKAWFQHSCMNCATDTLQKHAATVSTHQHCPTDAGSLCCAEIQHILEVAKRVETPADAAAVLDLAQQFTARRANRQQHDGISPQATYLILKVGLPLYLNPPLFGPDLASQQRAGPFASSMMGPAPKPSISSRRWAFLRHHQTCCQLSRHIRQKKTLMEALMSHTLTANLPAMHAESF